MKVLQTMDDVFEKYPHFFCPVSCDMFIDPVINSENCTYERHDIESWYEKNEKQGKISLNPTTGLPVKNNTLTPNTKLKKEIIAFVNDPETPEFVKADYNMVLQKNKKKKEDQTKQKQVKKHNDPIINEEKMEKFDPPKKGSSAPDYDPFAVYNFNKDKIDEKNLKIISRSLNCINKILSMLAVDLKKASTEEESYRLTEIKNIVDKITRSLAGKDLKQLENCINGIKQQIKNVETLKQLKKINFRKAVRIENILRAVHESAKQICIFLNEASGNELPQFTNDNIQTEEQITRALRYIDVIGGVPILNIEKIKESFTDIDLSYSSHQINIESKQPKALFISLPFNSTNNFMLPLIARQCANKNEQKKITENDFRQELNNFDFVSSFTQIFYGVKGRYYVMSDTREGAKVTHCMTYNVYGGRTQEEYERFVKIANDSDKFFLFDKVVYCFEGSIKKLNKVIDLWVKGDFNNLQKYISYCGIYIHRKSTSCLEEKIFPNQAELPVIKKLEILLNNFKHNQYAPNLVKQAQSLFFKNKLGEKDQQEFIEATYSLLKQLWEVHKWVIATFYKSARPFFAQNDKEKSLEHIDVLIKLYEKLTSLHEQFREKIKNYSNNKKCKQLLQNFSDRIHDKIDAEAKQYKREKNNREIYDIKDDTWYLKQALQLKYPVNNIIEFFKSVRNWNLIRVTNNYSKYQSKEDAKLFAKGFFEKLVKEDDESSEKKNGNESSVNDKDNNKAACTVM